MNEPKFEPSDISFAGDAEDIQGYRLDLQFFLVVGDNQWQRSIRYDQRQRYVDKRTAKYTTLTRHQYQ